MGKKIMTLLVALLILGAQTPAMAESLVTLNQLIEESKIYDNQVVRVSGEVLLEAMERKEGTWVNINDGTNAMGLFIEGDEAKQFEYYGDYHTTGDTIEIEAVFHRSCKEHGGDMDLHLIKLIDVKKGHVRSNVVNPENVGIALMLTVMTFCLILYHLVHTGTARRLIKKINGRPKL